MLSQKLRNYFHQVVLAQEKALEHKNVPYHLTVDYQSIIGLYRKLNLLNWDVDLAVLKIKVGSSLVFTSKENKRVFDLLLEEAHKNKNPLTSEDDVIKRIIELLDRTQDQWDTHKSFLPFFKESYEIWKTSGSASSSLTI